MVHSSCHADTATLSAAPSMTRKTRPVSDRAIRQSSSDDAVNLFVDVQFGQTAALGVISHTDGHWLGALGDWHSDLKQSFAEVTSGDIPALFVFRVAAASTSVDGHTWWFIEDVGGSPKLPAHVDTHFPGHALSPSPLRLYAFQDIQIEVGSSEGCLFRIRKWSQPTRLWPLRELGRGRGSSRKLRFAL